MHLISSILSYHPQTFATKGSDIAALTLDFTKALHWQRVIVYGEGVEEDEEEENEFSHIHIARLPSWGLYMRNCDEDRQSYCRCCEKVRCKLLGVPQ